MNFLKHHIIIISAAALVGVGIILYAIFGISKPNNLAVFSAAKMTLQEEVRGDGNVKAAEAVDLAFERGGKIVRVYSQTGDKVKIGQSLISLDASDLSAQLAQAEADVKAQQARLDELNRGARPEDIANQNIAIQNAETFLADADSALADKLQDAYTKADDAVRNKADQMFSNPQTDYVQTTLSISDSQLQTDLNSGRLSVELALKNWKTSLDTLTPNSDFSSYLSDAKQNLAQVDSFLEKLSLAINNPNNCANSNGSCQPISGSWKTDIATARTNINVAVSSLTSGEAAVNSAQANLDVAMQGLTIKEAGAAPEEIAAQAAQLERSQAAASMVRSQLAKTVLRSPIDGVVSIQNGKAGAIASPNQPIVSVLSDSKYQIEIFVSEADIAKVKVGQDAKVTLDAFGESEEFAAQVIKTDPAATNINGVDAYKITLQLVNDDTRIKVGMGANVKITTASSSDVLAVPESAIITRGNDRIVLVKQNGLSSERQVEVGIKSADGYVEIISGLKAGDQVVVFNGEQK